MDKIKRTSFEILRAGGYHPGRKVDCTGVIQFLADRGFVLNKKVVEFLKEFGQLEFETINRFEEYGVDVHHTLPKKAIGSLYSKDFAIFEESVGEKLVPVGELFNRYLYLFVSENGNLYTDLGLLGSDVKEVFENILDGKVKDTLKHQNVTRGETCFCRNICVFTDKTMPDTIKPENEILVEGMMDGIKFAANDNFFIYSSLFFPEKDLGSAVQYKNYHKFMLTDAGIDRIISEYPELLNQEEVEKIRLEMFKLREKILDIKRMAKEKNKKAFDGSYSFEMWPVEYCAQVWAARNAILMGVRFDKVAFSLIRPSDKSILNACNNCKLLFKDNYKVNPTLGD